MKHCINIIIIIIIYIKTKITRHHHTELKVMKWMPQIPIALRHSVPVIKLYEYGKIMKSI